jgi:hypothetical protein
MEDVEVIDDFMPEVFQHWLADATIYNTEFPWKFLYDMSGEGRPDAIDGASIALHQGGFQHTTIDHISDKGSEYAELFDPIVNNLRYHYQSEISVVRIKIGLVLPVVGGGVAYPHTDYKSPHRTLVYYVNDTDGDTVFYNEWQQDTPTRNFTVEQRVSPKMGRAVIFNGLKYHSTEYPTKDIRGFVNINFKLLDK